jgi:hypothetical protein
LGMSRRMCLRPETESASAFPWCRSKHRSHVGEDFGAHVLRLGLSRTGTRLTRFQLSKEVRLAVVYNRYIKNGDPFFLP